MDYEHVIKALGTAPQRLLDGKKWVEARAFLDELWRIMCAKRSTAISTHFHAHVWQLSVMSGAKKSYVYTKVLLMACQTECDGGEPYPFDIIDGIAHPISTTMATNKQMVTAVFCCHALAAEWGYTLKEKPEWELKGGTNGKRS